MVCVCKAAFVCELFSHPSLPSAPFMAISLLETNRDSQLENPSQSLAPQAVRLLVEMVILLLLLTHGRICLMMCYKWQVRCLKRVTKYRFVQLHVITCIIWFVLSLLGPTIAGFMPNISTASFRWLSLKRNLFQSLGENFLQRSHTLC